MGLLARVLWLSGNRVDADRFCSLAEELADPDDVGSQVYWRITRSGLLVAADPAAARALADEAVGMADGSTGLIIWADALRGRADVLDALGEPDAARRDLEQAAALYERKGDVVSTRDTRGRLAGGVAAGAS